MDLLNDELERMATNFANYSGGESGSEIPLDHISGLTATPTPTRQTLVELGPTRGSKRIANSEYLIKLEGPLADPQQIKDAAGLPAVPTLVEGTGDDGDEAAFCRIAQTAKNKVEEHLTRAQIPRSMWPVFIRLSQAAKDLSSNSPYPTLSLDPTLPHNRPSSREMLYYPLSEQYPVWYFVYGTLADPDRLHELLGLPTERPILKRANVVGGTIKTWAGKYKALIDGPDTVEGWAYQVQTKDYEDALRIYETEHYEVVRCKIGMHDEEKAVWGCTFRFIEESLLD